MTKGKRRGQIRREVRRKRWKEKKQVSRGLWSEAWFRYRELFSIIPSPALFTREENEGAIHLGLVRIPALIAYVPFYFVALLLMAIPFYPILLLQTWWTRPRD